MAFPVEFLLLAVVILIILLGFSANPVTAARPTLGSVCDLSSPPYSFQVMPSLKPITYPLNQTQLTELRSMPVRRINAQRADDLTTDYIGMVYPPNNLQKATVIGVYRVDQHNHWQWLFVCQGGYYLSASDGPLETLY